MATTLTDHQVRGELALALFHAVGFVYYLCNRIGRYSSFYGAEDLGCFNHWGDEGEFFEMHFALLLPFEET